MGRRWGLIGAASVFSIGAGIMLAATSSTGLAPIYAGRVLAGAGIGAASNLAPLYISEIAPPAIRGQLLALYEIGWQIGALVGYVLASWLAAGATVADPSLFLPASPSSASTYAYVDVAHSHAYSFWINYGASRTIEPGRTQWLLSFAVQLVPSGIFLAGLWFLVESPRWLIRKGRREEGLKKLAYLRQLPIDHEYLQEEIQMVRLPFSRSHVLECLSSLPTPH